MHHARIDRLAYRTSPIHRLESRTKLLSVIVFTIFVICQPPAAVSIVVCYAVWPFAVLVIGGIPLKFVLKHILIVSPFVAVLAATTLFYDRTATVVSFGPWAFGTTTGLLRCLSIIVKFTVTVAALIALVATTRFNDLLGGLSRLGVPRILVMQLGFLYRYIFLLIDRAEHMLRARAGRRLARLGPALELKTAAAIIGTLCLQSIEMAWRVNTAMQARGFDGRLHTLEPVRPGRGDLVFVALTVCFLIAMHIVAAGMF